MHFLGCHANSPPPAAAARRGIVHVGQLERRTQDELCSVTAGEFAGTSVGGKGVRGGRPGRRGAGEGGKGQGREPSSQNA